MTFSTPDASVFSATECFPFEVQLTCNGVPTQAPVTFQSRYVPMPTVGSGTFFSSSDCQGPIGSAQTGQRSFRVASTGLAATAGSWELTAAAMGTSSTKSVTFSGKLESAGVTQLVVGVCLPLQAPRFVGLNDSSLVAYGLPTTFELTLPVNISVCGSPTTFTLNGGQSIPGSMPSVRATSYFAGVRTLLAAEQNVTNLGLQVAFDLTVCAPNSAVVPFPSGCCQPAGSVPVDGGYLCP